MVTSSTDFVAIVLGVVAIIWGSFAALSAWNLRARPYGRTFALALGIPLAAVAIGVLQVLRGIGIVTAF